MKKTIRRNYVRVKRRLIVAEPAQDGSGYSWTLAAALGEMLLFAEEKFGPHDTSYTLLGIEFSPDGAKTWTPGNCGHIIIHLDLHCLTDRQEAYCQLAHEWALLHKCRPYPRTRSPGLMRSRLPAFAGAEGTGRAVSSPAQAWIILFLRPRRRAVYSSLAQDFQSWGNYATTPHECIHLLSPTGKADANVLEEGLAVYFEKWYMHYVFGTGWWSGKINIHSYARAFELANQLLALDPDIIKKLRAYQPVIAQITAEQILEHCPTASQELAQALTDRFSA